MAENVVAAAVAAEDRARAIMNRAIQLGTQHAAALQHAAQVQQQLQQGTPDTLENTCLELLRKSAARFLHLKQMFSMLPGPMTDRIWEECGDSFGHWCRLPLVLHLVTPLTRYASLDFNVPRVLVIPGPQGGRWVLVRDDQGHVQKLWSEEDLRTLLDSLLKCAKELETLKVRCDAKESRGFSPSQLQQLLHETGSLTTFRLMGREENVEDTDAAIGTVMRLNPDLRALHTRCLGPAGLSAIAAHGRKLRQLNVWSFSGVSNEELASALSRLPELQAFDFKYIDREQALYGVAEQWDPSSPPRAPTGRVAVRGKTAGQVHRLLSCFPHLNSVQLDGDDEARTLCEGLGGLNTDITEVTLSGVNPDLQRQLYTVLNQQLTNVTLCNDEVDLGALGQGCPNLENLIIETRSLLPRASTNAEPPEAAFSKLKNCDIFVVRLNQEHTSSAWIQQFFSGPHLERVIVHNIPLPDAVVIDLISASEAAAPEARSLSSLLSLELWQEDIGLDAVIALVSYSPRLRRFGLHSRDTSEQGKWYRDVLTYYMAHYCPHVSFGNLQ